jgi:hypothetical protein
MSKTALIVCENLLLLVSIENDFDSEINNSKVPCQSFPPWETSHTRQELRDGLCRGGGLIPF